MVQTIMRSILQVRGSKQNNYEELQNANFLQLELNSFSHDSYFALNLHLKLSKNKTS